MASHATSQGPGAFSAAALRRALLLPLALSASAGIVALALTAHVHDAVTREDCEMLVTVAAMSIATALAVIFVGRRLKVLSGALGDALHSAEQTSHLKDEFMATLSHELKTPINAVLGWTTLLRRRADDPATVSRAVERIDRNARRQARLIDDMVDMFCIATGQLTLSFSPVDVASAVEWTVGRARQAAQTKGVSVVQGGANDLGAVWGDPRRVRQILGNLLDHAVKATDSGGHVMVEARSAPDSVQLRVSDTRRGAPEAGPGLTLTIVHRLVALHGGTFHVESPGDSGGETFVVTLPPAPCAPAARIAGHAGA